jgi:tetratricopeptide (TPR) repeat protein
MAADNAKKLRERIQKTATDQARAALLAVRGVSATNRNDWLAAKQDFLQSYSLDPNSAFSLNNLGYLAEKDGDLETAQFFYARARKSEHVSDRVGLATRHSAEGKHLSVVATDSDHKIADEIVLENQARRRQTGPIELKHRDNTAVEESPGLQNTPVAAPPVAKPPIQQPPK